MSSRRPIYVFLAVASFLSLLLSYAACRAFLPFQPTVREWKMSGAWVTTAGEPGYAGYFRKSFLLPAEVQNAWLAVSACDTYEVIVNGQECGAQRLWPPNLPFQYTTSAKGQRLININAIPNANYPREYQWETYANYQFPIFFDLGRSLKQGRNCICVRVDTRKRPVKLCVQGEVLLTTGERVSLDSGPDWKAATVPRQDASNSWTDGYYNDFAWPDAVATPRPGPTYSTFAPEVFTEPFRGKFITPDHATQEPAVWFLAHWDIEGHPDEAWLKLLTNRRYALYINGHRAEPPSLGSSELNAGDWIVNTRGASGKQWQPDSLDPDDIGSLFNSQSPADDIEAPPPQPVAPNALLHDQQIHAFDGYSIGGMVHEGRNEVAVRLIQPGPLLKWTPKLALEANAISAAGRSTLLTKAEGWTAESRRPGSRPESLEVAELREAVAGYETPLMLRYLGYCYSSIRKFWEWTFLGGAISLAFLGILLWFVSHRVALLECALGEQEISAGESRYLAGVTTMMAFAAAVFACTLIAESCFAARAEVRVFMTAEFWLLIIAGSGMAALLVGLLLRTYPCAPLRLPEVIKTYGFKALFVAMLVLCALLRLYKLEYQSTDSDEWASLQSILAIADTGAPRLTPDVVYTRSPFYHYLLGGLVLIFGKNLWAFRLPTVAFAVGTAALIYEFGKRLLRSRWTGLAAATLFCFHPLLINIGHQIRFYQQQQFFALLTVYCFCRGFVEEQQMKWRYLTLVAFVPAVFSQEISVIIGFTLVASYLLFAERKPWTMEMRFVIGAVCVVVFVVLDFLLYQTVCMTVADGVSPQIQPQLKLNLLYPCVFYWFFLLFSRLHLGSSILFFLGLPFALRDRNRSMLTLYLTFFGGIVLTTILITSAGFRFEYWLMPLYFLLLVRSMMKLGEWAMKPAATWFHDLEPTLRGTFVAMALATVLLTWSPWKIPGSYSTKLLADADGAMAYISHNILPRDALAVAAPYTHAAFVEVGRVNYDIEVPFLYDFAYRKNGVLRDRNAGAEVISTLDQFQDACARHERVWVVLTRGTHFRSPGETITWVEPGGRFDLFIRTNCELKYQTYLADVFLWDWSRGRFKNFRRE